MPFLCQTIRSASFQISTAFPFDQCLASFRNISGCVSATRRSVLAAPDGLRFPCSHACNVRTETPINLAKAGWDMLTLFRARVISETTTTVFLAAFFSFICLADSRRSSQNAFISLSIDKLLQFQQYIGRQIVEFGL